MTDREHEQLLTAATDRFERRLSQDIGAVRVDMAAMRLELAERDNATQLEIARLRVDMTEQFAEARVQTESRHRELLKWALMFWVAQAAATAGIVGALT